MNLLNNKQLLRNLLFQGDQLNTLSGGVAQVTMEVNKKEDGFLIKVYAPGISPENLKVISETKSVQIYAKLDFVNEDQHQALIPLFYRKLDLPSFVDTEAIEAVYQDSKLEVFIPIGRNSTNDKKEIDIKQL